MYVITNGEQIRAMRQERGLSRQDFAHEARIGVSTARRVERGDRVMAGTGWRVAHVFGVHPQEIGRLDPTNPLQRQVLGLED